MPAKMKTLRTDSFARPFQNFGSSSRTTVTIDIRHHTSGNAGSDIAFPSIAVNPQSMTQKWISSHDRRESDMSGLRFSIRNQLSRKRREFNRLYGQPAVFIEWCR